MLFPPAFAFRTSSSITHGFGNNQTLSPYLFLRAPLRMIVATASPGTAVSEQPSRALDPGPETRLPPRNSQFYEMPAGGEKVQVPQSRRDLGVENASKN